MPTTLQATVYTIIKKSLASDGKYISKFQITQCKKF